MIKPATLLDVPGLEGLGRACRRFQIQFTCFGGVIRRYVAWLIAQQTSDTPEDIDLFGLTPFLSDIDLVHTGGSDLTIHIVRFLQADLPFAECFRWELRAVADNAVFRQALFSNGIIPANLMSLSTNAGEGIADPWDGWHDIAQGAYRYIRNGFYPQSPLYQAGRDLEFFSVLLYLRVLLEAGIAASQWETQPGWHDAVAVIHDAQRDASVAALQESAYLRVRLRYLLKGLVVAARTQAEWNALLDLSGLRVLLQYLDDYCATRGGEPTGETQGFLDQTRLTATRVLVSSGRIGGDLYRLPHHTEAWATGSTAQMTLNTLLRHQAIEPVSQAKRRSLGEGQKVLLASPPLPLRPGVASSSRLNQTIVDEFIHFAVPISGPATLLRNYQGRDLAAVLTLTTRQGSRSYTTFFPLTAVCAWKEWGETPEDNGVLLTLRINCGAMLEIAHDLCARWREGKEPTVRLFVLGWDGV